MLFAIIYNHAQHSLTDGFTSEDPTTLLLPVWVNTVQWGHRLVFQKLG